MSERPKRMFATPFWFEPEARTDLWVPPEYAADRHPFAACPPEAAKDHKMVAFKFRLSKEHPWLGQLIHCPIDEDLDAKGGDSLSPRDQIHRLLVGLIEASTKSAEHPDGVFVYQDSDQMQGLTWIDQWPELKHGQERWDEFVRFDPPKRDSEQKIPDVA